MTYVPILSVEADYEHKIMQWLLADDWRMRALNVAKELSLGEWCLAAGFVRNLVWDKLHDRSVATGLNDIDLIYFDDSDTNPLLDEEYEAKLSSIMQGPWSVKNQARMHVRNNDSPYQSMKGAMTYWVEVETAVGVYIQADGRLELVAPLGLKSLFDLKITMNAKKPKPDAFLQRVDSKKWIEHWPLLKLENSHKR